MLGTTEIKTKTKSLPSKNNMLGTTEIKAKTKSLPSKNSRPSRRDRKMNKEVQN